MPKDRGRFSRSGFLADADLLEALAAEPPGKAAGFLEDLVLGYRRREQAKVSRGSVWGRGERKGSLRRISKHERGPVPSQSLGRSGLEGTTLFVAGKEFAERRGWHGILTAAASMSVLRGASRQTHPFQRERVVDTARSIWPQAEVTSARPVPSFTCDTRMHPRLVGLARYVAGIPNVRTVAADLTREH
jgi:hypothetical protein